MKFKFKYFEDEMIMDVNVCRTLWQKASGLMFRKKSPSLLFDFGKLCSEPIHSFFCVPFIAIWFDGDKIVDVKKVMPWKFSIKPVRKFDKLLEIPSNQKIFCSFPVEERKL